MLPVVTLVGRPNVGKSTLFNRLTRSRDALVADFPGLTRDRQYGVGRIGPRPYVVVDTGGLSNEAQGVEAESVVGNGPLEAALRDVAKQRKVDLIALGRPAGEESFFELGGLKKLAERIEQDTGIETQII